MFNGLALDGSIIGGKVVLNGTFKNSLTKKTKKKLKKNPSSILSKLQDKDVSHSQLEGVKGYNHHMSKS